MAASSSEQSDSHDQYHSMIIRTMGISLDALQVLDAIDRRGSFAAAAEELHRVPSAITYQVQQAGGGSRRRCCSTGAATARC